MLVWCRCAVSAPCAPCVPTLLRRQGSRPPAPEQARYAPFGEKTAVDEEKQEKERRSLGGVLLTSARSAGSFRT